MTPALIFQPLTSVDTAVQHPSSGRTKAAAKAAVASPVLSTTVAAAEAAALLHGHQMLHPSAGTPGALQTSRVCDPFAAPQDRGEPRWASDWYLTQNSVDPAAVAWPHDLHGYAGTWDSSWNWSGYGPDWTGAPWERSSGHWEPEAWQGATPPPFPGSGSLEKEEGSSGWSARLAGAHSDSIYA